MTHFAGGLMGYLAMKDRIDDETLRQGIIVATALASFCVEAFGVDGVAGLSREVMIERMQKLMALIKVEEPTKWMSK